MDEDKIVLQDDRRHQPEYREAPANDTEFDHQAWLQRNQERLLKQKTNK